MDRTTTREWTLTESHAAQGGGAEVLAPHTLGTTEPKQDPDADSQPRQEHGAGTLHEGTEQGRGDEIGSGKEGEGAGAEASGFPACYSLPPKGQSQQITPICEEISQIPANVDEGSCIQHPPSEGEDQSHADELRKSHIQSPESEPSPENPASKVEDDGTPCSSREATVQRNPVDVPTFDHRWDPQADRLGQFRCKQCGHVANTGSLNPPAVTGCPGWPLASRRVGAGHKLIRFEVRPEVVGFSPAYACQRCHRTSTGRPAFSEECDQTPTKVRSLAANRLMRGRHPHYRWGSRPLYHDGQLLHTVG